MGLGHLPFRGRAPARHRRDGLRRRLPARRSTRSARRPARGATTPSTRRARRPRVPLCHRLARRRARRDPPRPRHLRGLRPLRRRGRARRARGRPRHRAAGSPDHPWVTDAPGVVHDARRTARIAYAENPPKKYQDIYPLNFDNDPAGLYAEVRRGRPGLDRPRGARSSASTTRTPSRSRSGSG